jgi:ABC-type nitrate/sulfonate/bicarbonate transport system ATPase subunit
MRIDDLSIAYGGRIVFDRFSISFEEGRITAVLGPSGCGKTTLLNAIAFGEGHQKVSYIFQEPRLLPWCSLEKNIMMVLEGSTEERRVRARMYLEKVGLLSRASSCPGKLSGGERQRAAIARAFSFPAPVLLMDEPFQSQDPRLKIQLIETVKDLQAEEKRTIIAVTHDVREAASLADRAVVLNGSPVSIILDIPVTPDFEHKISEVMTCQTSIW